MAQERQGRVQVGGTQDQTGFFRRDPRVFRFGCGVGQEQGALFVVARFRHVLQADGVEAILDFVVGAGLGS